MSIRVFIIGLVAFLATGCNILGDPEEQTIINLDEIYEISLHQDLKPGGNSLILNIATEKELQCPDASLNVHRTTLSNELSIRINNGIEIKDCEPELIQIEESISTLLDKGNFDIQFIVNSIITDSGILNIEDDHFQMILTSFDGIRLINPILKMVPDDAIWGVLYTDIEGQIDNIQNVEDEVHTAFGETQIEEGNYGYFTYGDKQMEIHHTPDIEVVESRYFLLNSKQNSTQILEWKSSLEEKYPNIYIDIFHGSYGKI